MNKQEFLTLLEGFSFLKRYLLDLSIFGNSTIQLSDDHSAVVKVNWGSLLNTSDYNIDPGIIFLDLPKKTAILSSLISFLDDDDNVDIYFEEPYFVKFAKSNSSFYVLFRNSSKELLSDILVDPYSEKFASSKIVSEMKISGRRIKSIRKLFDKSKVDSLRFMITNNNGILYITDDTTLSVNIGTWAQDYNQTNLFVVSTPIEYVFPIVKDIVLLKFSLLDQNGDLSLFIETSFVINNIIHITILSSWGFEKKQKEDIFAYDSLTSQRGQAILYPGLDDSIITDIESSELTSIQSEFFDDAGNTIVDESEIF